MTTNEEIQACLRGDRTAQKRLFERSKSRLFGVCLRYAATRTDAEDILQEGFVRVFRDLAQFRGDGNFEGWMRQIFVRTALGWLRRQRGGLVFSELKSLEIVSEDPVEPFIGEETTAQNLLKILAEMPSGYRSVFNLHVLEGYSHPEIAEILGISVGASKSQLSRAKAHFRLQLEDSLTT